MQLELMQLELMQLELEQLEAQVPLLELTQPVAN